jgi:hypothetical protein
VAAHRYWRAKLLQAYDGGSEIELTEFWLLFEGSRVDTGATLTCDESPHAGSLANLSDDDLDTGAVLPVGSTLTWDFDASPVDVDDIRLGSAERQGGFLGAAEIAYSDDGVTWTPTLNTPHEYPVWYAWPGSRTLTTSVDDRNWTTDLSLAYVIDQSDGRIATSSGSVGRQIRGSARRSTGIRQFEITRSTWSSLWTAGVIRSDSAGDSLSGDTWLIRPVDGTKGSLGSSFTSYPTGGWSASDVFGVVIDFVAGTMTVYKNGVSLGVAFDTLSGEIVRPSVAAPSGSDTVVLRTNDFAYPIAGAQPWTHPVIEAGYRMVAPSPVYISNGGHALGFETTRLVSPTRARPNFIFDPNARGRIVSTVKRKDDPANVPLSRRVRLYRDRDGMLIAETRSDAAGNYQFDYIEEGEAYTALALDHQHFYRAVAADNLTLANGSITLIDD